MTTRLNKSASALIALLVIAPAFLLAASASATSAQNETTTSAVNTPKGSLVIIGGALRVDNAAVWQRIVQQAGGKGASIAVIPSASANPERSGQLTAETLTQYGANAFVVPVSVKHPMFNYQDVVHDPNWVQKVRAASGVYFTGGDQGRTTQALVQTDGQRSPLLDAIWDVYQRGGVIAGSSAGAAIMSTTMFYDARPVLPTLQSGVIEGKDIAPGLGFIGSEVFVDQHLIIRGRFARMLPVMLKKNYKLGLGIDENSAMVITGQRQVEVLGYKGAILLDLSGATVDAKQSDFNLSNAHISYLDNGDKFDLHTKQLTLTADKLAGKVDPAVPHNIGKIFRTDVLANTVVVDLLYQLIDSKEPDAIGLAFAESAADKPNNTGFEFRFSKTPQSEGYYSSATGTEAYSVQNIRLDVRPVTMTMPLYK